MYTEVIRTLFTLTVFITIISVTFMEGKEESLKTWHSDLGGSHFQLCH